MRFMAKYNNYKLERERKKEMRLYRWYKSPAIVGHPHRQNLTETILQSRRVNAKLRKIGFPTRPENLSGQSKRTFDIGRAQKKSVSRVSYISKCSDQREHRAQMYARGERERRAGPRREHLLRRYASLSSLFFAPVRYIIVYLATFFRLVRAVIDSKLAMIEKL